MTPIDQMFLAGADEDARLIARIESELNFWSVRTWFYETVPPSSRRTTWDADRDDALQRSSHMVVFNSGHAASSRHVKDEYTWWLQSGRPILVVVLDATMVDVQLVRVRRVEQGLNSVGAETAIALRILEEFGHFEHSKLIPRGNSPIPLL